MQFVNEQEGPSNKEEVYKKTYLMDEDYDYRLCLRKTSQMLFNSILIFTSSKSQITKGWGSFIAGNLFW